MKIKILSVLFFIAAFSLIAGGLDIYPCGKVIFSSGNVTATTDGLYTTGNDTSLELTLSSGGRIRMAAGSKLTLGCTAAGAETISLTKGRAWIKAGGGQPVIEVKNGRLKAGGAVLDLTTTGAAVYSGKVNFISGKESIFAGRGITVDFFSGKARASAANADEWAKKNLSMDKFDLFCRVDIDEKYREIFKSTFRGAFSASYEVGLVYFADENTGAQKDFTLEIKADTTPKKERTIEATATIKDEVSGETIAVINSFEEMRAEGERVKATQSLAAKVANEAYRAIENYLREVSSSKTKVFVETQGYNTKNINEIKGFLEKMEGVASIKSKDFYGQKTVFEMECSGSGYDVAQYLQDKKVDNNAINIWKYSKFVVKLSNK